MILPAEAFDRPADAVARSLLGARLVAEVGGARTVCEIVETEAYTGPDDAASHAHIRFGVTPRNRVMYGPPGIAYVYLIYGMHWCLNVVTGPAGHPAAVLIRAARPLEGLDAMRARRPGRPDVDLLRGPGKLTQALGIDGTHDDHPLQEAPLWLEAGEAVPDTQVVTGPRIGITRDVALPLRFLVRGSRYVSSPRTVPHSIQPPDEHRD
jgi:DNA-3-methyladenine glycosylase